jgi:hypothetical protein
MDTGGSPAGSLDPDSADFEEENLLVLGIDLRLALYLGCAAGSVAMGWIVRINHTVGKAFRMKRVL